jgi:vesicle-associated membrane protein 7
VSQIHNQVEDVKRVMMDNVEKVIERGERLDDLLSKTENLESHVSIVSKTT